MVLVEIIIKIFNVLHSFQKHSYCKASEAKLSRMIATRLSAVNCERTLLAELEQNQYGTILARSSLAIKVLKGHAMIVVQRPTTFYFRNANP